MKRNHERVTDDGKPIFYKSYAESCRGNGFIMDTNEYYFCIRDRCHGDRRPIFLDDDRLETDISKLQNEYNPQKIEEMQESPQTYTQLLHTFASIIANTDVTNIYQSIHTFLIL